MYSYNFDIYFKQFCQFDRITRLDLNWPKLARFKDKWNVYTMYAVFSIVFICMLFILRNVLLLYLTIIFFRYTKNRAHKCKNTTASLKYVFRTLLS